MAWFDFESIMNWAKEKIYGPPPPPLCEQNDFLCQWSNGEHKLKDLPRNLLWLPVSAQFLNPFITGGVLAGASLAEIHPWIAKGAYWTYRGTNVGLSAAQVSPEAGWLGMNYLTANVVGACTDYPNLAFLAACTVDLGYKAYAHPEQCIGAAADMVIGYVAFAAGDKLVRSLFEKTKKADDASTAPKKRRRKSVKR